MEQEPEAVPASAPATSGVLVQPDTDLATAVPEAWLQGEVPTEAEKIDRLAEDYNLVQMLALEGFTGPKYDYFATELAKYGIAVIEGWMRRRMIFAKCRERGYGGLPEPPARAFDDPDVVSGLAGETVAVALDRFRRDVLMQHRWDYRRGASLRTYFIGQCLMRFANVYRKWWNDEIRRIDTPADLEALADVDRRRAADVEEAVATTVLVGSAMSTIADERVRRALVYVSLGYKYAEIAAELGVTEKAVERMISNERARIRKRGVA